MSTKNDRLLKQYELTQQSAEFHDRLSYTVIGLMIIGMTALLGLVVKEQSNIDPALAIFISILGVALCVFLILVIIRYSSIKREKYKVCKKIEKHFGKNKNSAFYKNHRCTTNIQPSHLNCVLIGILILFAIIWIVWLFL